MQIQSITHDDLLELRVTGRLDAEWAATLQKAIEQAIRQGQHAVVLDVSDVAYISSAGLSVLVHVHRQFQQIRGFFGVGGAHGPAHEVIQLTGLDKLLLCDLESVRQNRGNGRSTIQMPSSVSASDHADFEIYELSAKSELAWRLHGDPSRFDQGHYRTEDAVRVPFPNGTYAVGMGAFGAQPSDCADQFGELLAAAGAVAVLPTNGANRPDYQLNRGNFVPVAQVLQGVSWSGDYAQLIRFDTDERTQPVAHSRLVDQLLTISGAEVAGCVLLVETTGLVGAALRKSPTLPAQASSRFDHPEIRDWLSFSPERVFGNSLVVIVGVACRGEPTGSRAALQPFVRPLQSDGSLYGHFHAAVFPFQPFKKRKLELEETLPALFDSGQLQGLLHLMHDERPITGAGESAYSRGACWVAKFRSEPEVTR